MDTHIYMSIPYTDRGRSMSGANCYGLVWLIYARELGIVLPKYDDDSQQNTAPDDLHNLIKRESDMYRPVKIPQPFDMVMLRIGGLATHIGCMIDANNMIHLLQGCHVAIENVRAPRWRNRIVGFYRHEDM